MEEEKKLEWKFKIQKLWKREKVMIRYMLKEPFYEARRFVKGSYDSMLMFWFLVLILFLMITKGATSWSINIMVIIVVIFYYLLYRKYGKWKEYYEKEFIRGEEIE